MRSLVIPILVLLAASAAPAVAQPQAPMNNRPTFSPYLNLLRGTNAGGGLGGSAGFNYFSLVRPEMQLRQQSNQLQTQLNQTNLAVGGLAGQVNAAGDASQLITGRGATFGNYSHYYPALGGGGGSFSRGGFGGGRAGGIGAGGGASGVGRLAGGGAATPAGGGRGMGGGRR